MKSYWEKELLAEHPLKAWFAEAEKAVWLSPNELKQQYRSASIVTNKRVVFNIHGNRYRLLVDIEYRLQTVFIVWVDTHQEYDKIDAKTIRYVKAD
ncbi:type II toxin-antitoxin system HigB family toxin [Runella zeae]|uniref:type II toxin-antitoxin system HigB family toxin n=1 Tax=Runella zeae TaxID=94255 RepID=UPI001E31F822|nr:type II toxin-antitoxin system HigB family toxin [Runella zeae]